MYAMHSHQPHATTGSYRVLITDHITPELVNGAPHHYQSPPQTEQQAKSLLGADQRDHGGPWRQAIAGGQRIIELRAEP
jgi:hypothetical protein